MKILIYTRRNINAATEQQPTITNHMRNIQVLDKQKIAFRDWDYFAHHNDSRFVIKEVFYSENILIIQKFSNN